jgi:putative Mg2+ transporter-C (MgtC) family protein
MNAIDPTAGLPLGEALIRIGFSLVAGLVLGLERESHGRAAGLKTTVLACVASCLAMILSEDFYREAATTGGVFRPDRARLAAGILTGIGFLGAGAIIRQGTLVRGVTTAAVLWFITILGLSFGSGHLLLGGIGTAIAMLALFALPHMEQRVKKDFYTSISVTVALDGIEEQAIRQRIEDAGAHVQRWEMEYDLNTKVRMLRCDLKMRRGDVFKLSHGVVTSLVTCPGITRVKWG